MAQYIDKSALAAEIERRKYQFVSQAESFHKIGKEDKESYFAALASNMNSLSCFLDTLEVKEPTAVFIEKACDWLRYYSNPTTGTCLFDEDIEKFRKAIKGE